MNTHVLLFHLRISTWQIIYPSISISNHAYKKKHTEQQLASFCSITLINTTTASSLGQLIYTHRNQNVGRDKRADTIAQQHQNLFDFTRSRDSAKILLEILNIIFCKVVTIFRIKFKLHPWLIKLVI